MLDLSFISVWLTNGVNYIDFILGGNEFAVGAVVATVSGAFIYIVRSLPSNLLAFFIKHTTTVFEVNSTADAYYSLAAYLNSEGILNQSRYLKVSDGDGNDFGPELRADSDGNSRTVLISKEIGYGEQVFWFDWKTPLLIHSYREDSVSSNVKEFLKITKIGRSHDFFNNLIERIRNIDPDEDSMTAVYRWDSHYKELITKQHKRSFDTLALEDDVVEYIMRGLDKFVTRESWFIEKQIPYQLGILLYGPPGTGKTSLIKAIAAYLNRDICYVDSEANLTSAAQKIRGHNTILVAEEIDTFSFGSRGESNASDKKKKKNDIINEATPKERAAMDVLSSMFADGSLGKLLNALDGVISNHGRIVIMTTNHPGVLDPALVRPGRIDLHVPVDYMSNATFKKMLDRFYDEVVLPAEFEVVDNLSPVDVQTDMMLDLPIEQIIDKYNKNGVESSNED